MTPKSLLTDPRCVSDIEDFGPESSFKRVIGDCSECLVDGDKVRKLILCTGKVYYDLISQRESIRSNVDPADVCFFFFFHSFFFVLNIYFFQI